MAPRKNFRNQAKKEVKPAAVVNKNGVKVEASVAASGGGFSGTKIFTWFMVLALLGVWSSVAVVWFDLVDYDNVIAERAKEFRFNFSEVLQGKLSAYDADGDGDFDVEDAKVLLGKWGYFLAALLFDLYASLFPALPSTLFISLPSLSILYPLAPLLSPLFFSSLSSGLTKDGGEITNENADSLEEIFGILAEEGSDWFYGFFTFLYDVITPPVEKDPEIPESQTTEEEEEEEGDAAKKKKPKLLNKFEKTIKTEIDAAEKLRKKGKVEEAVRAFETLVLQYPQSPRCRYGKALAEDGLAEKMLSNDMLQKAIGTYKEASELPNATPDLIKATLKKRAERQQFLGRMRGALATLEKLVQIFPEDMALKNDLGVAHLLIGDNNSAKRVYEEVLATAPSDGFAKVHYGFILKSENKIAESIPFLRDGLESGDPGTDDGRFYFHLGDALQRMGDDSAYKWYERGHQRGHFASVWQRSLYNVDGLKAQPWWTPKDTGYMDLVKTLERNWRIIRDEAQSVMDKTTGLFVPEEENLREKGEWGQFTLWQQGKAGESCRSVPKTCGLLERYPEATGCKRGQIKFSVMQPGTHVWPHTGPTNCRLRMHLGLVIPKTGCKIRCTNDTRAWEEGKVLIFDDSFEHEVWQDADSYRLIFIVDVWHPELTQYQRQTLSPI
uniref:Un-named hu7910 n=1 Tax=Oncorhynchus tshawytscha TaxID=74940 RepID=A0AAZ3NXD9_ONCTS